MKIDKVEANSEQKWVRMFIICKQQKCSLLKDIATETSKKVKDKNTNTWREKKIKKDELSYIRNCLAHNNKNQ